MHMQVRKRYVHDWFRSAAFTATLIEETLKSKLPQLQKQVAIEDYYFSIINLWQTCYQISRIRILPHSLHRYATRQIFIVMASLERGIAAQAPAFGHFHLAADG